MKDIKKKYMIILFLILSIIVLPAGKASAALQSNPNTHVVKKDSFSNWMNNFRKMEEKDGAMGLDETVNSDLTSTESNNIDSHMMKTTEYGAIAILSASGYGNKQNLQDSSVKTTTGNKTGVYFTGNAWERNAGGLQDGISNINERYYCIYTNSSSSAKVGDAFGCSGWHLATSSWVKDKLYWFDRDGSGIFSYTSNGNGGYGGGSYTAYSRGVVVCGEGL